MSVKKTTEQWILNSIIQHQKDLHLLFTSGVETMDIPMYNDIKMALGIAEQQIKEAIANQNIRTTAQIAKQMQTNGKKINIKLSIGE